MDPRGKALARVRALLAKVQEGSGASEEEARTAAVLACRLVLQHELLRDAAQLAPNAPDPAARRCVLCGLPVPANGVHTCAVRSRTTTRPAWADAPQPDQGRPRDPGCPRHAAQYEPACRLCHLQRHGVPPAEPGGDRSRRRTAPAQQPAGTPEERAAAAAAWEERQRAERAAARERVRTTTARVGGVTFEYTADGVRTSGGSATGDPADVLRVMDELFKEFFPRRPR